MNNDTILVTGGSGFIGSHLCEKLVDMGQNTVNLDNFCNNYDSTFKERNISGLIDNPLYHVYRGDIRDNQVLDQIFTTHTIGTIIHLAALAGVRPSLDKPRDYVSVDIDGTANLLEYATKYQIKRFLFASSSSVYGDNPVPFKESDRLERPLSPYAAAKISGEMFCRTYHQLYGFSIGCLRFFTVYVGSTLKWRIILRNMAEPNFQKNWRNQKTGVLKRRHLFFSKKEKPPKSDVV